MIRLKNRFAKPTPSGFRDLNLNARVTVSGKDNLPVVHICELQVHLRPLKDLDYALGSHKVYEKFSSGRTLRGAPLTSRRG